MTHEEHLRTLEARVTALETKPRIREAVTAGFILPVTPPKPAAEPLLTPEEAMLGAEMEEYERRLREVGSGSA